MTKITNIYLISMDMWRRDPSTPPTVSVFRRDPRHSDKERWRQYRKVTEASFVRVVQVMNPGHPTNPQLRINARPWGILAQAEYRAGRLPTKGKE
jgi:hypothetical protein